MYMFLKDVSEVVDAVGVSEGNVQQVVLSGDCSFTYIPLILTEAADPTCLCSNLAEARIFR